MNDNIQPSNKDLNLTHHYSYLLRIWRIGASKTSDWRASLELPVTGKRIGFANLEQLFAYLMDLIESDVNMQDSTEKKE
jgi:hypothetical protein